MREVVIKNKRILHEAYKRCQDYVENPGYHLRRSTCKDYLLGMCGKENWQIAESFLLLTENKTPLIMGDLLIQLRATFNIFCRTEAGKTISLTRARKELKLSKRMLLILNRAGILRGYRLKKTTSVFWRDVNALKKLKEENPDHFQRRIDFFFRLYSIEVE